MFPTQGPPRGDSVRSRIALICRVPPLRRRSGFLVRYQLSFGGEVTEVSVQATDARDPRALSVSFPGDEAEARQFQVAGDAVYEQQPDGSLKRFSLLTGRFQPQKSTFFHSGRVRAVDLVGGIGGRVESLSSEGTVTAPMNGQVVKVVKVQGETVKAGEIVLILEAMKMENEVTAPIGGVLQELSVEPGQTVSPGQHLFRLEAGES